MDISFSTAVGLLLHLQYYHKFEPMILKMWVRSEKVKGEKYSFFEKLLLLSISRNLVQTPSSDDIVLGNFTFSNWIILVEDQIRWKKGFEIFLVDHCAGDIGNKNIALSVEKFLYQCHPSYTRQVGPHRVLYL